MVPQWLQWAREIQAIAQTGSNYAVDQYQIQRYKRLNEIAAEIVISHSELDFDSLLMNFQTQVGYATPKLDVRTAAFENDKVLMVKEKVDRGWCLPGGWIDVGDLPSIAAERETFEESGFKVKVTHLIGLYDANRFEPLDLYHTFKLVFFADIVGGQAAAGDETSDVSFFIEKEIPKNLSGSRTTVQNIRDAFLFFQDPTRPTVFD